MTPCKTRFFLRFQIQDRRGRKNRSLNGLLNIPASISIMRQYLRTLVMDVIYIASVKLKGAKGNEKSNMMFCSEYIRFCFKNGCYTQLTLLGISVFRQLIEHYACRCFPSRRKREGKMKFSAVHLSECC